MSKSPFWLWMLFPANAALGGLQVLIPLYILAPEIRGTAVDVGLAIGLSNFVVIPGAILWGYVTDIYHKRKIIIQISNVGISLGLIALYFVKDIASVAILYSVIRFLFMAGNICYPLLLMESVPRSVWVRVYPKTLLISQIGIVVGVLPGGIWSWFFPVRDYFLILALLSIPSVIIAQAYVKEPPMTLETRIVAENDQSLSNRLLHFPLVFLHIPHPAHFRSFWKLVRSRLTQQLPVLYVTAFFYFLGGSSFFTAYIPFLKESAITDGEVFAVYSLMTISGAVAFPMASREISKKGEERTTSRALLVRIIAMGASAVFAAAGYGVLVGSIILLPILSVTFSYFHSSTNAILFRILPTGKQGELLGVYSAFTGTALFIGAILSGYISVSFGYHITFILSAVVMALSLLVFTQFSRAAH